MKMGGGSNEASLGVNLRVTAHSNQGGRKYMEDMFCVAYQPTVDDKDLLYAYFGIFDGHGGRDAAIYAKTHLMDLIVSQKNFWSDDDELVLKAIKEGFINTHMAMWKELDRWPKTPSGLPSTSGTTASILFVRRGKIYIGHVGDSAIIMGYQDPGTLHWSAKSLTRDHKPESLAENSRITQSGGKVINKSGVPRVVWNRPRIGHKGPVRRSTRIDEIPFLAVARSLGDLWSYNSSLDEFVVSPEPDVCVVDIDVAIHRCLILGSDGLWNMLSPQDAVNSVYFAEKNNERTILAAPVDVPASHLKNWINPSKRLVDRALDRWFSHNLRADNTSVVTVVIDPPGPPKAQGFRLHQRAQMARQSVIPTSPIIKTPNAILVNMVPTPGSSTSSSSDPISPQPQPQIPSQQSPLSTALQPPTQAPSPQPTLPTSPYARLFLAKSKLSASSSPTPKDSSVHLKEPKSKEPCISNQSLTTSSDLPTSSSSSIVSSLADISTSPLPPTLQPIPSSRSDKKRKRTERSKKNVIKKSNAEQIATKSTRHTSSLTPPTDLSDVDKSLNVESTTDDVQINEVSSSSDSSSSSSSCANKEIVNGRNLRRNQKLQQKPKTRLALSKGLKSSISPQSLQTQKKLATKSSKKIVLRPKLSITNAPKAEPSTKRRKIIPLSSESNTTLSLRSSKVKLEEIKKTLPTKVKPLSPRRNLRSSATRKGDFSATRMVITRKRGKNCSC